MADRVCFLCDQAVDRDGDNATFVREAGGVEVGEWAHFQCPPQPWRHRFSVRHRSPLADRGIR